MAEIVSFRQRLDVVLHTRDVKQVQTFLIAEKQWNQDAPMDAEFAMWMMIAGSSTLRELHEQARIWLLNHGHEEEAKALLGKSAKPAKGKRPPDRNQQARSRKW